MSQSPSTEPRRIEDSRFVITGHGNEEAPPGVGVWQYLVAHGARRVDTIYHPLLREEGTLRRHTIYERGRQARRRTYRMPSRPPYSFPLDVVAMPSPRTDLWIAFNNLLTARGLAERRLGRVSNVAYWAVDFVPDRFGSGPLTTVYDRLDAYCCRVADFRVDLSQAALDGRTARHGFADGEAAPAQVVPVGAWIDRLPTAPKDAYARRRLVFIGHLVERMGLDLALEAVGRLAARGVTLEVDVAGHGEQEQHLRALAERLGIAGQVHFHGFISDQDRLARLLAAASIALAPYKPDPTSFTRYADPSKLKGYLAAGLPILLTDVPPNAEELEREAGAEVLPFEADAWATALERALDDPTEWQRRRAAALEYARRFDWNVLVQDALARMGFVP
jgi:glycosyltransferase involved in cell wall biosynthesis